MATIMLLHDSPTALLNMHGCLLDDEKMVGGSRANEKRTPTVVLRVSDSCITSFFYMDQKGVMNNRLVIESYSGKASPG